MAATALDNILKRMGKSELVLPYFENAMRVEDYRPYYGRGDGYFHPSTHPLMGERELYYRFHPDTAHTIIEEPFSLQREMTVSVGHTMHEILQTMLQKTGLLRAENVEKLFTIEDHHVRGKIDAIIDHPRLGPLVVEIKALALDTPIFTTAGWSTMGELEIGDEVFAPDGQPTKITSLSPVWLNRPCYRVSFRDGQSVVADADHRWEVRDVVRKTQRVMTTQELLDSSLMTGQSYRFAVPVTEALQQPEIELPIDPWLLGMWLGDGDAKNSVITCGETDLPYLKERLDALGYEYSAGCYAPRPTVYNVYVYGLRAPLIALGLLGNKHIPERYLRASEEQRRQLLAGLMDSDGTIGQHQVSICMVRESLMRQVLQLVRSLGYRATWKSAESPLAKAGFVHFVKFSSRWGQSPFDMPRKRDRFLEQLAVGSKVDLRVNAVVSIEAVDSVPVRCISVAHESSLYLAGEGFVTTHNTRTHYKFAKTTEPLPEWEAQLSIQLDSQGLERGLVLMVETGYPFRLAELQVNRNDALLSEIYGKFDRVREAIAMNKPPSPCCAPNSAEVSSCPARFSCWMNPNLSLRPR